MTRPAQTLALYVVESGSTNPYENLALEEYLLHQVDGNACILYLWQNRHTVVIGRNQNAWRECRVEKLRAAGGFLARRPSGGGAVYHDLGNLNFTFLAHEAHYDVDKQLRVLQLAVQSFGIPAERSGRNDLTVAHKKISGNAFYKNGARCCHHGTLMVQVDKTMLDAYLQPSAKKLASKGVASVQARVANLSDFMPDLTVTACKRALRAAFSAVYGGEIQDIPAQKMMCGALVQARERFAAWEWIYGRPIPFSQEYTARFAWGEVQLCICVNSGMVTRAVCYSDAMQPGWIARVGAALEGCRMSARALCAAILGIPVENAQEKQIRGDIAAMLGDV